MGSTPLRQFLVSLCNDSHWKYSLFWKLNHQNPLILTCEDEYYYDTTENDTYTRIGTERSPIELLVSNLSRFQYALGEGLVGEVACTGNHMWVPINSFFGTEFDSKLVLDQMNELLLQVAFGIKTVLLVPVLPFGVIQLGSFEEVVENIADVGSLKNRFNAYRKLLETIPLKQPKYEKSEDFESENMNGFALIGHDLEIFDDLNILGFCCLEEDIWPHSLFSGQNTEFSGDIEAQIFENDYYINAGSEYKFHENGELHKALLGPSFHANDAAYEEMWDPPFSTEPNLVNQSEMANTSEYLLEAVITNLFSGSEDSCVSSQRQSSSFSQPQVDSKEVPKIGCFSDRHNIPAPVVFARVDSLTSLDGLMSSLTNEEKRVKGHSRAPLKGKKICNTKTSRGKNGNNHRPRPRDRQLIQDRVKELRELVPSSSKCSIDGLLDRTIKHMMYLRSVADQAEKLKGPLHHKIDGSLQMDSDKNRKQPEPNCVSQNGTSWALECGTENPVCPIVVEDLEFPGHLLIEVLCDDHGLFLEIAQLIRRLDLMILKGSMENRSSKTWAHFVVEASKGFHRMEIFWPVLHLLQRKRSRISSRI